MVLSAKIIHPVKDKFGGDNTFLRNSYVERLYGLGHPLLDNATQEKIIYPKAAGFHRERKKDCALCCQILQPRTRNFG